MDRRQRYRATLTDHGIPADVVESAMQLALPRIELRPQGHSPGPVVGVYGGLPSLPADVEWSGFPHFVASVDCAALPRDALDFPLPDDGHLLFFGNLDEPVWDEDKEGQVVYVPAGTPTTERQPDEEHAEFVTDPFPLHGHLDWNMPTPDHDVVNSDEERSELWEEYDYDLWIDNSGAGELTLGGYSCPAFDDPCLPPYPDNDEQPWRLLAQARVSPKVREPVENTLFWLMRPQDLAEARFERAKVRIELVPPA
ncbi:DUF1963 domain-containing protein [Streptomyces sp. NPDC059740]|uniref:DUF1963 domain-containing protein n=1 Tax=Streptomyces sp. NPDC059740 TaxID=3346926 RepID=UPI00364FA016